MDRFSIDVKMKFSNEKSKIMILNQRPGEEINFIWKMKDEEVEIVKEYKYLGMTVENRGLIKEQNAMRLKAEKQMAILKSNSTLRVNKYEIVRGIWKGVAVPTILYGIEILEVRAKDSQSMGTVQNRAARLGLGANKYAHSETLRGEMGWSTFEERIKKAKIKFFTRLKYKEDSRWAKKIMIWSQDSSKTIKDLRRRAERINVYPNERKNNIQIDVEDNRNTVRGVEGERKTLDNKIKETETKVKKEGLIKYIHTYTLAVSPIRGVADTKNNKKGGYNLCTSRL